MLKTLLGESGKVFEAWGAWEDWELYMKVDGKKDRIYDAEDGPLILECNELLDGEDTGASAKVYIMSDWLLHVFIEVTDPELVTPTADQQVEPAKGAEAFDCITVILDPKNYLDPTDNGYEPEETGDEPVDKGDMSKRLRIYRMDHTGFGYVEHDIISDLYGKYFTNNDLYGWGDTLTKVLVGKGVTDDNNDPSACVGVELTDKGYNIEFAAPLLEYREGTEYGINIILSDAYNGGESVSHYTISSSTDNKEPMNLAKYDYFCLGAVIVDMPPEEDTQVDTSGESSSDTIQAIQDSDSTAGTKGDATDSISNSDGGNNILYIIIAAAVVLVAAGIIIYVLIRRKGNNKAE